MRIELDHPDPQEAAYLAELAAERIKAGLPSGFLRDNQGILRGYFIAQGDMYRDAINPEY